MFLKTPKLEKLQSWKTHTATPIKPEYLATLAIWTLFTSHSHGSRYHTILANIFCSGQWTDIKLPLKRTTWYWTVSENLNRAVQKREKEKKEKKREISGRTHVDMIITFPIVIPTLPAISLFDSSSFLSPPLPFFYFFSFFLCFGWTIIYFSIVLCGSWFMSHLNLSCEFTVVFWNLKQLLEFLFSFFFGRTIWKFNFTEQAFYLVTKRMCLLL